VRDKRAKSPPGADPSNALVRHVERHQSSIRIGPKTDVNQTAGLAVRAPAALFLDQRDRP
jgi:hypothetical protein